MSIQAIVVNKNKEIDMKDQKIQFNKFRRIFHPDKLQNNYYKETAQQVFNNIIHSYKVYDNSLQQYLFINYGELGIKLYQNFHEFFELIEQEIQQDKYNQDYIFEKYSIEIQQIIDFLYYNDQIVQSMLFSTQINYQFEDFQNLKYNNISTTFSYPIRTQLFGMSWLPSLNLDGNLDKGFDSSLGLQVSRSLTMNNININLSSGFNTYDVYSPNCRMMLEYKKLSLSITHKIGSSNYDAIMSYQHNENQAMKLGCEYQDNLPNFYVQFFNGVPLKNGYFFQNDHTLSAHIIRNNFKLKKEINKNFILKSRLKIITSFHHYHNQYYKIGQFYLGFLYKQNAYEFRSGINFQHMGIQYFEFTFKLYNFKLKIPIIINDNIKALLIGFGLFITSGLFFGIKSLNVQKKIKRRKLFLQEDLFQKVQGKIDNQKLQFLVEESIIQKAILKPLIIKNLNTNNRELDVTKLIQQQYFIEEKISFNKLKLKMENFLLEESENLFEEYDFELQIVYLRNDIKKLKKICKNETTHLKQLWLTSSNNILMALLK